MNAAFRHLTIRLWLTAVAGGLICLALLPWWQRMLGIDWLMLPTVTLLTACFALIGWGMNRAGVAFVDRQIKEAAVWERAGMLPEAEAAFDRAVALFDSFWLSPLKRRQRVDWITSRLARFYLSQPLLTPHARAMVHAYLRLHPEDAVVAESWLENAIIRESAVREDHEIAARIGETLVEHFRIQRLLLQFYLVHRRADFAAMQTYRRVWQTHESLPEDVVRSLARLLLNEAWLGDWALKVYLKAYAMGDSACLEGIAAGVRWLRPNADNRQELAAARKIVADVDQAHVNKLVARFADPAAAAPATARPAAPRSVDWSAAGRMAKEMGETLSSGSRQAVGMAQTLMIAAERRWRQSAAVRRAVAGVVITVSVAVLILAGRQVLNRSRDIPVTPSAVNEQPLKVPPPVLDPFTIQVAAYLNPKDAQRFVDQLKKQGLDAFWNTATSADRQWYQVKVSHFATRQKAQQYGEQLKAKGLIDDFYVANYKQPQTEKPKQ